VRERGSRFRNVEKRQLRHGIHHAAKVLPRPSPISGRSRLRQAAREPFFPRAMCTAVRRLYFHKIRDRREIGAEILAKRGNNTRLQLRPPDKALGTSHILCHERVALANWNIPRQVDALGFETSFILNVAKR